MADEDTTNAPERAADAIVTFDQVLYWVNASVDDFDVPGFRQALPPGVRQQDSAVVCVAPRNGGDGVFHAFFGWIVAAEDVTLTIDYHHGAMERASDEHEPYAEDLMQWVGRFFSTDSVTAHAHVRLRYSTSTHRASIPMSLAGQVPGEAELYGVALHLRGKPSGATSVRLTRGQSHWYTEVIGERTVSFSRFTPLDDVAAFRAVLEMFIEESPA